jgi:hypothetical protein
MHVRISEHLDPLTVRGGRKRALWIGEVDSFNEIAALIDQHRVHFAAIDHLPEGRLARGLAQLYPGRVYVVHYSASQKEALVVDHEYSTASVRRNDALDATVAVFRMQQNLLPEQLPSGYVEHLLAPRRVVERDELDRITVSWVARSPEDYFRPRYTT